MIKPEIPCAQVWVCVAMDACWEHWTDVITCSTGHHSGSIMPIFACIAGEHVHEIGRIASMQMGLAEYFWHFI
jgi:hypothetical protein